jgi:antitoxin FitA
MATLTIRNVDDAVADALKETAAAHGRSMEAEVRQILTDATRQGGRTGLGSRIHARFADLGDLEAPRADDRPRAAELDA